MNSNFYLVGVREAPSAPCVGNLSVSKTQQGLWFSLCSFFFFISCSCHYLFSRFIYMLLFCICSQELLEAVERERNFRFNPSRNATIFHHPTLGDFELQHVCSPLMLVWKHFVLYSCIM